MFMNKILRQVEKLNSKAFLEKRDDNPLGTLQSIIYSNIGDTFLVLRNGCNVEFIEGVQTLLQYQTSLQQCMTTPKRYGSSFHLFNTSIQYFNPFHWVAVMKRSKIIALEVGILISLYMIAYKVCFTLHLIGITSYFKRKVRTNYFTQFMGKKS